MVDGVNLFFFFIAVDRVLSYSDFERGFLLFEGVVKFKTRFFTYFRKNTCHLLRVTHRLRHNLPAPYAIPRVSPNIGAVILVVEREAVPQLALGHAQELSDAFPVPGFALTPISSCNSRLALSS